MLTGSYRRKRDEQIISELLYLSGRYKITQFLAGDNVLDFRAYGGFLPKLGRMPIDLKLSFEIKANLKRDDVRALCHGGVTWVQPGVESFSSNVLKILHKGVTPLQNAQALKWLREYGLAVSFNILCGFPGETDDDYAEMMKLIRSIWHLPAASVGPTIVQVHRYSPLAAQLLQGENGRRAKPSSYYSAMFPEGAVPMEEFAYYYDWSPEPNHPVWRHREELATLVQQWRHSTRRIEARLGPGFITVTTTENGASTTRPLDRVESVILVLADRCIDRTDLVQTIADSQVAAANEVETALTQLQKAGLVIEQGNQLLAAPPLLPRPQFRGAQTVAGNLDHPHADRRQETGSRRLVPFPVDQFLAHAAFL